MKHLNDPLPWRAAAGAPLSVAMLASLLFLFPALAPAADVNVFPAPGVDFTRIKTFKMLPTRVLTKSGVQEDDPVFSPMINAAVRRELLKKGLTEVHEGEDIQVAAGGLAVSVPQLEAIFYNIAGDASFGTYPITTVGRYNKEGTLIVNLIGAGTNKSVWLGLSKRALGKPSKLEGDVSKAAAAMFNKYPGR